MVHIKKLSCSGLFSYSDKTDLEFPDHTVIVGPNNSGKSNLFRIIQVLMNTFSSHRGLSGFEISHKGDDPFLEVDLTLSEEECKLLANYFAYYVEDNYLASQEFSNFDTMHSFFGDVKIRIRWKKTLDESGTEPFVEILFNKCGFMLSGAIFSGGYQVTPLNLEGKRDLPVDHQKPFQSFLDHIFQEENPIDGVKKYFDKNEKTLAQRPISGSLNSQRLTSEERRQFQDLMSCLEVKNERDRDISLSFVLGTVFSNQISHATESRNLLPKPIAHMYEILSENDGGYSYDRNDANSFAYEFNRTLRENIFNNAMQYVNKLDQDGSNMPQVLFSLRNSSRHSDRAKFQQIKEAFEEIFGSQKLSLDVILQYKENRNNWYDEPSKTPLYPKIVIFDHELSKHLPMNQVGAGVREVIYLLTASYGIKNSIILLDEPGTNLHPTILQTTMRKIENIGNSNQFLITTHSPDLLNFEMFEGRGDVIYVKRTHSRSIVNVLSGEDRTWFSENRTKFKHQINPKIFFARCVILTEGESDRNLLGITDCLGDEDKKYDLASQDIVITSVNSKNNFAKYRRLLDSYDIPYVILADKDSKNDIFEESDAGELSADGLAGGQKIIIIQEGGLEDLLQKIDPETYDTARKSAGRSKPAVAMEFCRNISAKDPELLKPIREFLDFCIGCSQ